MGRKGAKVGAFPWCSALQLTLQLTGEQHWGHVGDVSGWTASHRLKMGHPGETRWVCGASPCRWSHVCHMCHMLCLTVHSEGVNEISRNTILGEGTYLHQLMLKALTSKSLNLKLRCLQTRVHNSKLSAVWRGSARWHVHWQLQIWAMLCWAKFAMFNCQFWTEHSTTRKNKCRARGKYCGKTTTKFR